MLIIIMPFLFVTQKSLRILREDRRNYATASILYSSKSVFWKNSRLFAVAHISPPSYRHCSYYTPTTDLFQKVRFPDSSAKKTGYSEA